MAAAARKVGSGHRPLKISLAADNRGPRCPGKSRAVRRRALVAPSLPCLRLRLRERFRLEGWEAAGRGELSQGLAGARCRNSAEGRRPGEDPPRLKAAVRPQELQAPHRRRRKGTGRQRTPGAAATAAATAAAAASGIATGSARRSTVASARAWSVKPRRPTALDPWPGPVVSLAQSAKDAPLLGRRG